MAAVRLVVARLGSAGFTLLVLSALLFALLRAMPGDPTELLVTANPSVRPDDIARLRKLRGLDRPWYVAWSRWLWGTPRDIPPPRVQTPVSLDFGDADAADASLAPVDPSALGVDPERQGVTLSFLPPDLDDEGRPRATIEREGSPKLRADRRGPGAQGFVVEDRHGQQAPGFVHWTARTTADAPGREDRAREDRAQTDRARQDRARPTLDAGLRIVRVAADAAGRFSVDLRAEGGPVAKRARFERVPTSDPTPMTAGDQRHLIPRLAPIVEVPPQVRIEPDGRVHGTWPGAGPRVVPVAVRPTPGTKARWVIAVVVERDAVVDEDERRPGALAVLWGDGAGLGYSRSQNRPVVEALLGPPNPCAQPGTPCEPERRAAEARLAARLERAGPVQNTLWLTTPPLVASLVLALALALLANRPGFGRARRGLQALSTASLAVPAFWLGLLLLAGVATRVPGLPTGGLGLPGVDEGLAEVVARRVRHSILPWTVLVVVWSGRWFRYADAALAEQLRAEHLQTARAKGLRESQVQVRHALPAALVPVVTVVALSLPSLFGGALLTETVFSWPGMGRLLYEAILAHDEYLAAVVVLCGTGLVFAASALADLALWALDPRARKRAKR